MKGKDISFMTRGMKSTFLHDLYVLYFSIVVYILQVYLPCSMVYEAMKGTLIRFLHHSIAEHIGL
jgi:hypothetical protein